MKPSEDILQDLLLDAIRKIDAVSDKVDSRIDALSDDVAAHYKELRQDMQERIEPLEKKLEDHTEKISKHEHHFAMLGFLLTGGGIASLTGMLNWIGHIFTGK